MDRAEAASAPMPYFEPERSFRDGLGERLSFVDSADAHVEHLVIRHDFGGTRSFEFALRERVSRLASFRHPAFARVHGVERLAGAAGVVLVSDETAGVRLSTFLESARAGGVLVNLSAALGLIRQLVWAIAALHERGREIAHGALAPERLILTPRGRLVVTEHVLGSALEQLLWPPAKYWTDLRVALPRTSGLARFDQVTDVTQIGVVSLALILGRPLREDEYPWRVTGVIQDAQAIVSQGQSEPLHAALRSWVERAMQVDPRRAFASAIDASTALDQAIAESGCDVSALALEQLLARYGSLARTVAATVTAPPLAAVPVVREPDAAPSVVPVRTLEAADPVAVDPVSPPPATPLSVVAREVRSFVTARPWTSMTAALGAVAVVAALVTLGSSPAGADSTPPSASTGTLTITTEPPAVAAAVDGTAQGRTPLTLTLEAGWHRLELRGAGGVRTIPVLIKAGERASQYVDLPMPVAPAGQLRVSTDPPGTEILVDGTLRGVSPLVVGSLAPGTHVVTARSREFGTASQPITLEAGVSSAVLLTLAKTEPVGASGWIGVTAAFPIQIFEDGALIGSSESERVMVAAGRHEFELRNERLGYSTMHTLTVAPGKLSALAIESPQGRLAINAQPWAEVWVDGTRAGETPIGNLSLPIGSHEVVFRHPELGEQTHTALVTLNGATRVSATFKK